MSEPKYKLEYLAVIDTSNGFSTSLKDFRSFLSSHKDVSVTKKQIKFRESSYRLSIVEGKTGDPNEVSYRITIDFTTSDEEASKLREILSGSLKKVSEQLGILRDDFSRERSQKAYSMIYDVENSMRRLITTFMRINVGRKWTKIAIPDAAKVKTPESEHDEPYVNYYDFIEINNFLFREYPDEKPERLLKDLQKRNVEEIGIEEFKKTVPRSNWDRYFSDLITLEGETLKDDWRRLYIIRNIVAHNRLLDFETYRELKQKCEKLTKILESAISNLGTIDIKEEDIQNLIRSFRTKIFIDTNPGQSTLNVTDLISGISALNFTDTINALLAPRTLSMSGLNTQISALNVPGSQFQTNLISQQFDVQGIADKLSALTSPQSLISIQSKLAEAQGIAKKRSSLASPRSLEKASKLDTED